MESFYFLCHGQTDWEAQGLLIGQRDPLLNPLGRKQALEAAGALVGNAIASLCYSPLVRTKETAEIVAAQCHCSLYPSVALLERAWGAWEGQAISAEQLLGSDAALPAGAESYSAFKARVLDGFKRIIVHPAPILFVSHRAVLAVICQDLGIAPVDLPDAYAFQLYQELGKWKVTDKTT